MTPHPSDPVVQAVEVVRRTIPEDAEHNVARIVARTAARIRYTDAPDDPLIEMVVDIFVERALDWRPHNLVAWAMHTVIAQGVAEGILTAKLDHSSPIERWVVGSADTGHFVFWRCGCMLAMTDPKFSKKLVKREQQECVLATGRRFQ